MQRRFFVVGSLATLAYTGDAFAHHLRKGKSLIVPKGRLTDAPREFYMYPGRVPTTNPGSAEPMGPATDANPGNFRQILSEAKPGSRIVLADGDYGKEKIVFGRDNITVEAANPLGAKFSGDVEFTGTGNTLSGIDYRRSGGSGDGAAIVIAGKDNHFVRSRMFLDSGRCIHLIGQECSVRNNDISVYGKETTPGSGGGFSFVTDPRGDGRNNLIAANYFHDGPMKKKGNYHAIQVTGIGVGQNPVDFDKETHLTVQDNLFENCGDCDISIKTSRNRLVGNTVTGGGSTKSYGNQRSGNENEWLSNWFDPIGYGASIVVHGGMHSIVGNRLAQRMLLQHGTYDYNQKPTGDKRYHRANGVYVAENDGTIVYGHQWGSQGSMPLKATNCKFCKGQKIVDGGGTAARMIDVNSLKVPPARKLTTADVGPAAPESATG